MFPKRVRFADDDMNEHDSHDISESHVSPTGPHECMHGSQTATENVPIRGRGNDAGGVSARSSPPTSYVGDGDGSEPGQPDHSILAPESDPSLSAYESLAEQLFNRIREGIRVDGSVRTNEQLTKYGLVESKGLLWKQNLLYVPKYRGLRDDILYWHHDVPWCGHLGIHKTVNLVQRQFWWPGMAQDIKDYVQSCYKCQSGKPDRRCRRVPLTFIEAPNACWRTLGVDLIADLTPTASGYNAILVFCCHLSKMVRVIPTKSTLTTEGFVDLFFKEIFPHYGFPAKIVSDRGSQWNSEFFRALCDRADIRLSLSTAYHPNTNGLTERTNEMVETALRHYVGPEHTDWDKYLPFVEFALNDSVKDSTGTTPYKMNRVTVPLAPFQAVQRRIARSSNLTAPQAEVASWVGMSMPSGERTFVQAQEEFARARRSVHWVKCKMKEMHDRQGVASHSYKTGDLVWLSSKHISLRHPSLRHKFSPKFYGPMKVIETSSNGSTVLLELPASLKIHPRVSVSRVKPCKEREGFQVEPVTINSELEWEVEAILDHKVMRPKAKKRQGFVEFRIKWKGHYEPSWQGFDDCQHCMEAVEQYLNTCTPGVRAKVFSVLKPSELEWLSPTAHREALATRDRVAVAHCPQGALLVRANQ